MLIVDKHCGEVCCDKFPVPQTDRKSKQVKEHSDTENFICNQCGEKLAALDTKISKFVDEQQRSDKNAVCLHFLYLLNICRKFEFFISQRSVAT